MTRCDIYLAHRGGKSDTIKSDSGYIEATKELLLSHVHTRLTCLTTSGGSSLRHCLSCREAKECRAYDMVPYSIHRDRLERSISRARLKQLSTAWECFQMGPSLFSSFELSLSWIRLALAKAMPAQESNLMENTHTVSAPALTG